MRKKRLILGFLSNVKKYVWILSTVYQCQDIFLTVNLVGAASCCGLEWMENRMYMLLTQATPVATSNQWNKLFPSEPGVVAVMISTGIF